MVNPFGATNAHTHLYSGLCPFGMPAPSPAPENFVQILERLWWKLDRCLDAETLALSARYYIAQALLAGTTTLIDHHESPHFIEGSLDILARECERLGIRAVLCYGATERNFGESEAERGLKECARFVRENRSPLVRGLVGLHASFTVSDGTLRKAGNLARELGCGVHVHVAEDLADVRDAVERGYLGPLERLIACNALPPGSVIAHGVHLSEEQVRLGQEMGGVFIHNPRSNANNRVGYAKSLRASDRVALGTDGFPADMDEELRQGIAIASEDEGAFRERFAFGTEIARSLFGEATQEDLRDRVRRDGEGTVTEVVVSGTPVVRDGMLVRGNLREISAEAELSAKGLWKRMSALA